MATTTPLAIAVIATLLVSGNAFIWHWPTEECESIVDVAINNDFTILAQAVEAAGLVDKLSDKDLKVTVFAPVDEAFLDLLQNLNITADTLLDDKPLLTEVLQLHIVPGRLGLETWEVPTLNDDVDLTIAPTVTAGNTAQISTPGVRACHSIVYPIDTVLLPPSMTATLA